MEPITKIKPAIKDYAWGDDHFIADLLSIDANGPMAELWLGANRQGSATVEGSGEYLSAVLDADSAFCGHSADDFPILMKVLAIAQSLSIQCHPDSDQARRGYEAESDIRRKLDRSLWNYKDPYQKAEMLYALTPVTAMCGFRTFDDMVKLLKTVVPNLFQEQLSEFGSIKELFNGIYRLDKDILSYGEAELLKNSSLLPDDVQQIVLELGDRYFGDPGVFSPLLLNIVHLQPGQALYLRPRILHAYIKGVGVELMNNSDNVLRGGLTPKHVDLDELERVMFPETYLPKPMVSVTDEGGRHFVCEGGFTLTVMDKGVFRTGQSGPRLFLCTEGEAVLDGKLSLGRGECCIAGDEAGSFLVDAKSGTVFLATANS